jgi:LysR family transcriptional regulator, nitrogen assimilation regulatory protein
MQTRATDFKLDTTSDLHRWRAFVAISELGSLTRAALFLDTNQSLLSRQLNKLERECGARLFNRTGRGVELSEVGERLFPQVKTLLANAEALEEQIHGNTREPSGQVTLGFLPSIALPMVGRLFSEVRKRYPQVSLKVLEGSSGQVEALLADARVDIAILYRYGTSTPENEHVLALVDSYLIGAAGDTTTQAPEVSFSALDDLARQRHMQLAPVIEADSLPLQKSLVANEHLFTVLPLHAVWTEVQSGLLQASRIVDPPFQRTISMASAKSKGPTRAVSGVAGLIVEIVDDMARTGMWQPGDRP